MGMKPDDPLPVDASKLDSATFVGDVVTMPPLPPLIEAARARAAAAR
jgi:shikimate dehydrogenase